ncbi:MAG: phosphatidylglycerophosphatase A family protein [Alkalibacterium gilvum]|uniref:Phosphatidylglycerophosphatase A n=1 Tax=Alkalibacterium gilvum TaxID=1130080 RepID=A0A1H6VV31_9LACT|nr:MULTISPECIES: phosphatidylglycerophosphatase A [Alkalibacterium]MDN6294311.1 phosphatidylglycerophosphatase A [Alkalibacterium sp.]MDN6295857.1 phosphatidylglycerophosphatase A [Alkalibacterium sp.]MDN6398735.1 phosphatidylglycerophosphatase A [Alkalibacterium sp.]SEJ03895.1 Phosphatidylglycerophosphatase A [Alkalibacterium gilvum]
MVQSDSKLHEVALQKLNDRGVELKEIAELVYDLQSPYLAELTMQPCLESVKAVIRKREVQNAILTGIELDVLTEEGKLSSPLQEIIEEDESLYGIDEILALSIVNVYGSIGFTNYGFLDKTKPKLIKRLDDHTHSNKTHTFLDDIVGAIAAAAASRLAHDNPGISKIMK